MIQDYPEESLVEIYNNLPENLKEVVSSDEKAEFVYNICRQEGVDEPEKVIKLTTYVLLGLLPPNELKNELVNDLKINQESADRIKQQIFSNIFSPVKEELEILYGVRINDKE